MKKIFEYVTTGSYLLVTLALAGMALTIMGWSTYEVIVYFNNNANTVMGEAVATILQSVGSIVISVGIEGLVYIFKAGIKDITLLLYQAALVSVSGLLIAGLGVFQRLSMAVEKPWN